jgi:hypothetical protein
MRTRSYDLTAFIALLLVAAACSDDSSATGSPDSDADIAPQGDAGGFEDALTVGTDAGTPGDAGPDVHGADANAADAADAADAGDPNAFRMSDPLKGSTKGTLVGGALGADGWTVTQPTDRLWYAIPRLATGSIEFTLAGVTNEKIRNGERDNEMFAMYEAGFGITEPIAYLPYFRNNHYKAILRIFGEAAREGQQKLIWEMCGSGAPGYDSCTCGAANGAEPFGGDGAWDGTPQRLRIEWGGGKTRYLRNGTEVDVVDWSTWNIDYGPSEVHFSLGTSRPDAVPDYAQLPVGAVFSDVVVNGTKGAEAKCR